jgi:hypothetical protein
MKIWKTTELDMAIAEEFFGWRWLASLSIPVRSHQGYPQKTRCKRFMPPDSELGDQWMEYFKVVPHEPAKGDEPLDYCYCSSRGPHSVPHFSGHEDAIKKLEKEIVKRGLFARYQEILSVLLDTDKQEDLILAACEDKCVAALATVRSKHIDLVEFDRSMREAQ